MNLGNFLKKEERFFWFVLMFSFSEGFLFSVRNEAASRNGRWVWTRFNRTGFRCEHVSGCALSSLVALFGCARTLWSCKKINDDHWGAILQATSLNCHNRHGQTDSLWILLFHFFFADFQCFDKFVGYGVQNNPVVSAREREVSDHIKTINKNTNRCRYSYASCRTAGRADDPWSVYRSWMDFWVVVACNGWTISPTHSAVVKLQFRISSSLTRQWIEKNIHKDKFLPQELAENLARSRRQMVHCLLKLF